MIEGSPEGWGIRIVINNVEKPDSRAHYVLQGVGGKGGPWWAELGIGRREKTSGATVVASNWWQHGFCDELELLDEFLVADGAHLHIVDISTRSTAA